MGISGSHALNQLYLVNLLLLIAVVALDDAPLLVDDVEDSFHRLIVGDALRVVALDDATELIRSLNLALLDDLIVADGVQHDVRGATTLRRFISSSVKNLSLTLMIPFLPISPDL